MAGPPKIGANHHTREDCMRHHTLLVAASLVLAAATPASAANTAQQTAMKNCSASWSAMSAADKAKTKHQAYMSSCLKDGGSASMSSSMSMSAGGTAKCKDGTTVTYKHRQGTCSGHGGVASWM